MSPVTRRALALLLLVAASALASTAAWHATDPAAVVEEAPPAPPGVLAAEARLSLLVVGDTGAFRPFRPFSAVDRAVGAGMAQEDRRSPADAVVLLGDNFYWDGLRSEELVTRVRANLVRPFCHFLDLSGPRSGEVDGACPLDPARRHPVPIYAVMGNHDHKSPESLELQSRTLPEFVPNWTLPEEIAATYELGEGVSLVLVDSPRLAEDGSLTVVREALTSARGPWRIIALHHPLAQRYPDSRPQKSGLRSLLRDLPETPQLVLSGHEHTLELVGLELDRPALQVVSGAGSKPRELKDPPYLGRLFSIATAGFARVDVVETDAGEGLRVSLFTVPRSPWIFWRGARRVATWWLERDGTSARAYPKSAASSASSSSTR